ncbi:hypothetical protein L479_02943 [Exiguobacterium sp. S17]|nr:hypothetical protein L479_02943 [Exiguobacterium sp. S17]
MKKYFERDSVYTVSLFRSITLDELTIDELRFLGDAGFEWPECLLVVKSRCFSKCL